MRNDINFIMTFIRKPQAFILGKFRLENASVHSTKSGVTHFTAKTEEEGLAMIRKLLSYIPQNNLEDHHY